MTAAISLGPLLRGSTHFPPSSNLGWPVASPTAEDGRGNNATTAPGSGL